jgi:hypothetical protein
LYKYSSYDYRVIFFMSNCIYIILGHSVFCVLMKNFHIGVERNPVNSDVGFINRFIVI